MRSTTEFDEVVAFGSHGHTALLFRGMDEYWRGSVRLLAVIDELENGFTHPQMNVPVISMAQRLRDWPSVPVFVTPASTRLRQRVSEQLAEEDAVVATTVCPGSHLVEPTTQYGAGCLCAPYSRIGPNVTIGRFSQNLANLVAHDVEVGEFTNLNVSSSILGHVRIGNHVNIAPHAVISNGTAERPLIIGDGAIVGVGAVVTRDVPPGERVGGNPAMPIEKWKKLSRLLDE